MTPETSAPSSPPFRNRSLSLNRLALSFSVGAFAPQRTKQAYDVLGSNFPPHLPFSIGTKTSM